MLHGVASAAASASAATSTTAVMRPSGIALHQEGESCRTTMLHASTLRRGGWQQAQSIMLLHSFWCRGDKLHLLWVVKTLIAAAAAAAPTAVALLLGLIAAVAASSQLLLYSRRQCINVRRCSSADSSGHHTLNRQCTPQDISPPRASKSPW